MNAHSLVSIRLLICLGAVAALLSACSFGLDFDELEACAEDRVLVAGDCVCPEGFIENAVGVCVCPENAVVDDSGSCACTSPRTYDESGACVCDVEAGFTTNAAGQCICPEGQSVVSGVCACPAGTVQAGQRCVCDEASGFVFDAQTGVCVCDVDHFVNQDGVCGCPPLLVENDAADACVCPQIVPTEGGPVAISGSRAACNGFVTDVGVLGSGGRTLVDLVVVEEIPETRWRVGVLERLTQSLEVSIYVVGKGTSGEYVTQQVATATGPIESDFEGFTENALAGLALVEVDNISELVPVVVFSRAPPHWVDTSSATLKPIANADDWVTTGPDATGGTLRTSGLEVYRATGWVDARRGVSAMLFHGSQDRGTTTPWVVGAARFGLVDGELEAELTVSTLPVDELFTPDGGGDFRVALLSLGAITPVVNLSGVFVTAGAVLRGIYTTNGCADGAEACVNWGAGGDFGAPAAVELEYDASNHKLSARLATDTLDYSAVQQQAVEVLASVDLIDAENGDGEPDLSPDRVVFRPAGITGQGGELVAIARPFYFGCYRDAMGGMPPSFNDCSDPNTTDLPQPIELFGPTAVVTYSRSAQAFRTESISPAQDVIVQRVGAVDASQLGLDPSVRLLALTFENLATETNVLALSRINALDHPDVLYEFDGPSIDTFGGPQMFASGPFIFLETAVGVRVLAVSALTVE